MYTGKQLAFSSFSSNSGRSLTAAIQKFYNNVGKDYTIVHVSYSVAYLGKNIKGKDQMYHSAIVTHVTPGDMKI